MKLKHIIYFLLIFFSVTISPQTIEARPGGGQSFSYDDDDDYSYDDDDYSYDDDDDDYWDDDDDVDNFWDNDDDYSSSSSSSSTDSNIFTIILTIFFISVFGFRLMRKMLIKAKRYIFYKNTSSPPQINNYLNNAPAKKSTVTTVKATTPKIEEKVKKGFTHLYNLDENFSKVFFVDFVNLLAVRYFSAFGKSEMKNIEPYFSNRLKFYAEDFAKKHNITNSDNVKINEVVIGAVNFNKVLIYENHTKLTVDLEINFTLNNQDKRSRHLLSERWTFERNNSVKTKEPKTGVYEIACPNCGSNLNFIDQNVCSSCGQRINRGEYDWHVSTNKTKYHSILKQNDMFYYAKEKGASKKTIIHYKFEEHLNKFVDKHNFTDSTTFKTNFKENIVKPVFLEMYHAWSELKWGKVRHLLSDRMWESNNFWIKAYKHYNVVNKLDKIFINEIEFSEIETDKFFETITIRIWASCIDYVEEIGTGKFIAGDNKNYSVFSEYWTFVRRTGIKKSATELNINTCPNCSAPTDKIGQSAICEYCNTKISTGEFGWILSAITQDDVYYI